MKGRSTSLFYKGVSLSLLGRRGLVPPLQQGQKRFYCPEPVRRFYGDVNVVRLTEGSREGLPPTWGINLDKRQLKTPNKQLFQVDNESVAHAVANEWATQQDIVMLNTMHMNALANTSIDNPFQKTKFDICNDILSFLPLDTVLYKSEENERLLELQKDLWDPVIEWFEKEFDIKIPEVQGIIIPPEIPEESLASLRRFLMSCKFDAMLGLQFAAEAVKSLIITTAVVKNHITIDQALRLARLELDFQIKHWGNVEWAHDLENFDTMSRFASGTMFYSLNSQVPFCAAQKSN